MGPGTDLTEGVLDAANALAMAVQSRDGRAIRASLSEGVTLWSSAQTVVPPRVGPEDVGRALERLIAVRPPTRLRVLRNGRWSAVLAAFADDEAVWSLEVGIDPPRIDSLMVWMTLATRASIVALGVEIDDDEDDDEEEASADDVVDDV